MFSSPHSTVGDASGYDFEKEENAAKWKGVFVNPLKKVLEQVHPSLQAREDSLQYVETLILRLLGMLCSHPPPHTPQDVEDRVRKTFPTPIDRWALKDAKDALEKGKKKSPLVLPVEKIHPLLQKEVLQQKVDWQVTLFIVGVLEYISADILKLAGNYVKNIRHVEISVEDIKVAMDADDILMDLFYQHGVTNEAKAGVATVVSQTYEESVRDFLNDERHYLRDLQMIIKVFREEISKVTQDQDEFETLFSNIMDIYEITVNLLSNVEDVMEITEEKQTLTIGTCFEEPAEEFEFDAYAKYARDITSSASREVLTRLLLKPEVNAALRAAGHGFREAVKYYLPKLLMQPVWHCFLYFDYIEVLRKRSPSEEDRETLKQVQSQMIDLQGTLDDYKCKGESSLRMQSRARKQAALEKTSEMQKTVTDWDRTSVMQFCNEFIREDKLEKVGNGRKITERRAILFDGLLALCKPTKSSAHQGEKLKELFFIRKVDIIDREDTEEFKNIFEIAPRDHPNVILKAQTAEDKNSWMADLVMLNTKSMLERTLDSILLDEERKHPLKLPPPDLYKFAEPDSADNIVVEASENGGVPLIKGATLVKLVERLTYHIYADPAFLRTFLTTYRTFCTPEELLSLLIERFNIPEPSLVYNEEEKPSKKEDFKRYHKEFRQPVQFRVLNVLRQWVDHHFDDFERDRDLLDQLLAFFYPFDQTLPVISLENFNDTNCTANNRNINNSYKSMKKWVDSIIKIVRRRMSEPSEQRQICFSFERTPPGIEWHLKVPEEEWGILTLHPVEIARQLTLLEFELYRNVKPSELVGSVWTKENKDKTSPNLLKMIKHTTNFTRWLEKNILETENLEERVAIVSRVLEIMMVLQDLNNFAGVIAVTSAMNSAAVHRLSLTLQQIPGRLTKALAEASELSAGHSRKYQDKLRSINPPCVPFLGMYLTNIVQIEVGNTDFLGETHLINFSKRRKVAENIGEIQQYQNQPYCLLKESRIRRFIENLCPYDSKKSNPEIDDYHWELSNNIEPKGCKQLPKMPRKWPDLNLKSPGIKARNLSARLPAVKVGSVRLPDLLSRDQESSAPVEMPETPPHGSSYSSTSSDHTVFAQVHLGASSPNAALSSSSLSIGSPGNSPQLGSPGHILTHVGSYGSNPSSTYFGFNSSTIGIVGSGFSCLGSSSAGSPSASTVTDPLSSMQFPLQTISPGHQSPPPLPPRGSSHRRCSSHVDSPHQMRQAPNAPQLPPREGSSPPPIPPRREISSSTSSTRFPATLNPSNSALLARRNSTLENPLSVNTAPTHSRRHMSFNGPSPTLPFPQPPNGSVTPRRPPKPQIPAKSPATVFNFNAPPGSS